MSDTEPGEHRAHPDRLLREAARLAAAPSASTTSEPVYLAGGWVRDRLLGRPPRDLDLLVEGDGLAFARRLAAAVGGELRAHPGFGTAVVLPPEGPPVDVTSARSETYPRPAALPVVAPGTLEQDLHRRDFRVNAMALPLGPPDDPARERDGDAGLRERVIDPFGGRGDLAARRLRILHDRSFHDDPTRALRGVRLGLRLGGFDFDEETRGRLREALREGAFDALSGDRLREELRLLLDDPRLAAPGVARLVELGLLPVLHRAFGHLSEEEAAGLLEGVDRLVELWSELAAEEQERAPETADEPAPAPTSELWRAVLATLAGFLPEGEARKALASRLALTGEDRRRVLPAPAAWAEARAVLAAPAAVPHEIEEALGALPGEALLALAAESPPDGAGAERVRMHWREQRPFRLTLTGRDLLERGHPPGPRIGEALRAVRRARLDGRIGADEELAAALALLQESAGGKDKVG